MIVRLKESEKKDLSAFEIGQFVGARLAGASMTITALLNHGKTTSAKRKSVRKLTLTRRDRRTLRRNVLKTHRTTAAQVRAELNIHLEYPVSTKRELHKSNIHCRAAIAKPLFTESIA
jgi:hypothetical protein